VHVVDALKVFLNLRVIEAYHFNHLLNSLLILATLEVETKLPGSTFNPELEGFDTFVGEEGLSFLVGFLREKQLKIKFGEVYRDCSAFLIL